MTATCGSGHGHGWMSSWPQSEPDGNTGWPPSWHDTSVSFCAALRAVPVEITWCRPTGRCQTEDARRRHSPSSSTAQFLGADRGARPRRRHEDLSSAVAGRWFMPVTRSRDTQLGRKVIVTAPLVPLGAGGMADRRSHTTEVTTGSCASASQRDVLQAKRQGV